MPQVAGFVAGFVGVGAVGATASAWGGAWLAGAGFAASATGVVVAKLLSTVALTALSYALQSKPKSGGSGGIKTSQTLSGETNPETIILGWTATAGQAICPPMSHGKDHRYLTHVVELCSAPGATLNRMVINGSYVELEAAEGEYGRKVISGDYKDLIWVRYYDGSQTVADPMLVEKYGAYPDRPWTDDMVGAGICYAILTFRFDQKRMGSVPSYLFELTGIPVYDPRQDSTAGGSGPQRRADRATWAQSVNALVLAYNVMFGITLPGGDIYGGKIASSDLPMSVWTAAMNAADLSVDDGAGGTEPQYRAGLEISLADEPAEALEELLKAASAQIADIAGTWKVRAGAPSMPVMVLTDRDLLVNKEQTLDPFPALDSTYNGITSTFPDPDAVWQSKEAPARYNAEWEAADRFGRKTADIQLPAVPWGNQAQRLMRAWIEGERQFRSHKFTMPPAYAALEPLDCIAWSSVKNGYAAKQFEISETVDDLMTCTQGESLREVDPSDYIWTGSMQLPSTPSVPGYTRPAAEVLAGWALNATTVQDADGEARQVALAMSWDPDTIAEGVEWEIRIAGTTDATPGSTLSVAAGGTRVSEGILSDTAYEARGKTTDSDTWTDWATATTDALSLGLGDLSDELREFLESMQAWMDEGLGDLPGEMLELAERLAGEEAARVADAQLSAVRWRETRETVRSLQAQAIDLAAADHAARDQIRRSMAVELGTLRATYDEQIVTLADVGRAATLKIETLEVTSADQTARIQQVAQAQIEGDEALAQLITGLAVGNATQFDAARIWYFDASAEGWTGAPAAPAVISGGFLRPGAGAGGYIVSPAGLGIAGGTYAQVRLRLMRSGAPAWTGWLWWAAEGESWDSARRVAVPEPLWSGDEGLLTIQPGWTGPIDRIRLDLADTTALAWADIDWIAIGRPAPGASSADLQELQQAMTSGDQALAQSVQQLQADLTATTSTATGTASAVGGLAARVTATEGEIESLAEDMTALQYRVTDPETGNEALADAIDQVRTETQLGDGSQLVQSAAIRSLTSQLRALSAEGVEAAARDHAGRQDLRSYIAQASQSLGTRIDATDAAVEIVAEAVTALQAAIPGLATSTALQALQTVVTQQADEISSQGTWLTSLQSALDTLTGVVNGKASASALSTLAARVSEAEGDISSHSSSLTQLSSSLTTTNGNVAAAQQAAQNAASAAGAKGKVIYGSAAPAAADRLAQNLWIDTTGGANTPRRWNGTAWVSVTDKVATDAAAAAAAAAALAGTKADATAVTALTSRVTSAEGNITAQANAQTALNTSVGRFSASGLFRVEAEATPSGSLSRVGLRAAASNGEAAGDRSAAIYIEAIPGGKSRALIAADYFGVTHGGVNYVPFIVADGQVWINSARIKDADITGAKIAQLTVDTLNIKDAAVTKIYSAQAQKITGSTGVFVDLGSLTFSVTSDALVLLTWEVEWLYGNAGQTGAQFLLDGASIHTVQSATLAGADPLPFNRGSGPYGFTLVRSLTAGSHSIASKFRAASKTAEFRTNLTVAYWVK